MFLKRFLLLTISFTLFNKYMYAQKPEDYLDNWKKVEGFEKKGLTASALNEVINIFNLAVTARNDAQQVKAAIYQVKYRAMVEETSNEKNIFYIDTLVQKASVPAKNILQSMQAELLWNYRQRNRYRFYDRTQLAEEKSDDVSTWSIEKLNSSISELYKRSLANEQLLQTTSLNGWDAIIQKGNNTRNLRPTLYDFLAHRALSFFKSTENDVTKPSYKFIINDENAFAPAKTFADTTFSTKDSNSLYYNAIILLQKIIRFHLSDNDPEALIDADLIRLAFINDHGVFTNKDKLYEEALKNIETTYSSNPASMQALYLRAQLYYRNGNTYNPATKKDVQFELKKAKELCEEAIAKFPKSNGALNCRNLLISIQTPFLKFQTEKVNTVGQDFKSLFEYKNMPTVYLRVIRTSREEIKQIQKQDYEKVWKSLVNLRELKAWTVSLPDQQDYQQHAVELKTAALQPGTYIILASMKSDFSTSNNFLAWQTTYVSNISYIYNNKDEVYILNRDNGEPLANAELQLWQQRYNNSIGAYEDVKKEKYIADKNGFIKVKKQKGDYYNSFFQIKYNADELFTDDNYYNYDYTDNIDPQSKKTFLFTDRSIYRPGQTVFFKGIVVNTNNKTRRSNIIENYKTTVILYDVNDQKAGSLRLVSNEYGSYNGSFKLSENLLNGQFYIKDSSNESTTTINVEEYKRPKFLVEVKKPAGTYRVNDSIEVKGSAKAYAGNNIDGAKVTYRVVRKTQYPIWWGWGGYRKIWPPYNSREEMEITNGEVVTDSKGEFSIIFKAIPDETADKKNQPTFNYEVSVDITDLNGETRSGNETIAVAYQALKLDIVTEDKIDIDSLKNIKIRSNNLNDLFEKASVNLTVQKLTDPGKVFRDRYWQTPDLFVLSKEEFAKSFPYDAYADENEISRWPAEPVSINITDSTNENASFNINQSVNSTGWYKLIATTKDKYGEDVKAEKYILLTGKRPSTNTDAIIFNAQKDRALPGEKISYNIATGFDRIWLIHSLGKMDKTGSTTYPFILKSSAFSNEITITEADRGGINIDYAFIKHNRVYKGNKYFNIPWDNKDLAITYETFRDKILPGSEEKWKIKLTGNKSEKVAAETLISMYDASLDQFQPHSWASLKSLWPQFNDMVNWNSNSFTTINSIQRSTIKINRVSLPYKSYDRLLGMIDDYRGYDRGDVVYESAASANFMNASSGALEEVVVTGLGKSFDKKSKTERKEAPFAAPSVAADVSAFADSTKTINKNNPQENAQGNNETQIRKNFNETGFFFPALNTDANGNISFSFTIPEALTTWKMMTLAHSKDLASVYSEKTVITQKPLMVQPNAPRFLREGDRMEFSAKIVNLSDSEITGTAQLELFDASTNKPVDGWFKNMMPTQYFTVAAGQSAAVKFPVDIPFTFNSALMYRIKATSKDNTFSDGEEAALPVLTNRMLVTETMPLNMRNTTSKNFKFEKLLSSNNSGSLTNHALTIEYSGNPAWYAVQALPYLMEYPYECAEQSFNRYYANALASYVCNSTPKIKAVFEKWKTTDTAALLSNLQKNEELKSALLQETPWVLEAKSENEQKKNIAILFDMVRLSKEKEKTFGKLQEMQTGMGGFSWFKDGPDDRYITQYIITGIGHLSKLHALSNDDFGKLKKIIEKALPYLDAKLKEEYDDLKKYKADLKENNLSYTAIQYLYMRSFFPDYKINSNTQTAYKYYQDQSKKFWLRNNKYMQAMIALAANRTGDDKTAKAIIASLKENAMNTEEMGMYFKEFTNSGYYWYQSPIESQAMIIEAFSDIDKNNNTVNDLKTWLLKQKQTQNWKTTKATAEACYALLLNGSNWLAEEKEVTINVGNTVIKSTEQKTEAGTGYFKQTISGDKVQQGMGNISVNIKTVSGEENSKSTSWGAVYWQYFEDLDKITSAETPLKLVKKLFIEKKSDKGPVLVSLNDGDELHIGDKVKVRIELRADRDMEYIHMKDMRASCMEPVNVISQYKWQGGLGYYESTKDASTNFFFGWLPRGTYVFEYPMFVTHSGNFSNGVTTIQCMYAPEFTSHSEGIRVNVAEK